MATQIAPEMVVSLRLEKNAAGWSEVREAAMTAAAPITAASWRDVPFEMTASMLTLPVDPGPALAELLDSPAPRTLGELLDSEFAAMVATEQTVIMGAPATFRGPSVLALQAPKGTLTDEFMRDLAAAHRELVAAGVAPAPAIAEQTGAPVRTVHRWISNARKRGFLPASTRGRA